MHCPNARRGPNARRVPNAQRGLNARSDPNAQQGPNARQGPNAQRGPNAPEYAVRNNVETEEEQSVFQIPSSLDGLANVHPENSVAKAEDKRTFMDLLKGLLCLDGKQRLTLRQAIQKTFITMCQLQDPQLLVYLNTSEELMKTCPEEPLNIWFSSSAHCSELIGHTLQGLTDAYSIQNWIGEGNFARVAKCQAVHSKQSVAIKILKDKETFNSMEREVSILKEISILDPGRSNLVHFVEMFECMGLHCLAFEMLDIDLYMMMEYRQYVPLQMNEIRPIVQQLLVALEALKSLGILHCDIKPDNVAFTDLQDQPLRVKLIDFGGAMKTFEAQLGTIHQAVGYRAPEVTLGLPFTEAIDVWGVGCILAYLYLGDNLFPVKCEYQMVKHMVDLLGLPSDHLLQTGKYSGSFFCEVWATEGTAWRLLTPEEYAVRNNVKTEEEQSVFQIPSSLDGLANVHPENTVAKAEDKRAFMVLLKVLLCLDGKQRLTPRQALQYPFITMCHLQDPQLLVYLKTSEELMKICPVEPLEICPEETMEICPEEPMEICPEEPMEICPEEPMEICPEEPMEICAEEPLEICPAYPFFVFGVNITVQSDAPISPASIGQDSGIWSMYEDARPGSWDEHEPITYSSGSKFLPDTVGTSRAKDTKDIPKATAPKRFSFLRIRSVFWRIADVLFCCVRPQEDL